LAEKVAEKWPKIFAKKPPLPPLTNLDMTVKTKKTTRPPLSKASAQYWQRKVFREIKYGAPDAFGNRQVVWQSPNYYVRMQAGDQRRKVRLRATVAESAGREALAIYLDVRQQGWPEEPARVARKKTKAPVSSGRSEIPPGEFTAPATGPTLSPGKPGVTVGQWIGAALAKVPVRPVSGKKYAESLRTIVADILGLSKKRTAIDRQKIDHYPLDNLTTEVLKAWMEKRAMAAGADVIKIRRSNNTVRTLVANAKGLFTMTVQEEMGIAAEEIREPFSKLRLPRKSTSRYSSRFDARALLEKAALELGAASGKDESAFEQWKILYLALVAGLRYREIDNLRKRDVSVKLRKIMVVAHGDYQPKTDASEAEVTVSEDAAAVLERMLARTPGPWFVGEARSNRNPAYRSGRHHDNLLVWLRNYQEQGVRPFFDIHKPLHELRKEAGTLVNSQHGLSEARNFLRHNSIITTASYYVGSKGEITTGLS
jgi:hypothetical protein